MNTKLEEQIDEEVFTLSEIKKRKRNRISLGVRRKTGEVLHIQLTGENARDTNWYIGKKYYLTNIELHSRDTGKFLSVTPSTTVRETDDLLKILIFGDTHAGYGKRHNKSQNPEYETGGEFRSFDEITSHYPELDDTLLFHTGDLFDHNATKEDVDYIKECIEDIETIDNFRFIIGNHDQNAPQMVTEIKSLDNVMCPDGFERFEILGYNIIMANTEVFNKLDDFDWKEFERRHGGPNIFISHPSHHDVKQRRTELEFLSETTTERWILFLGHHHRPRKYTFDDLTVVFTGSYLYNHDQNPVWRFEGGQEYHQVTEFDVRSEN